MKYRVTRKQPNSKMCLVCGLQNRFGLKTAFYELENEELLGIFTPQDEHQSYPERLHGGISAAILDESIERAIMMRYEEDMWGVTMQFSARYKKPVPLNEKLRVVGRITKESSMMFEGSGEILLEDGTVAVEGQGKYLKMTLDKISKNVNPEHLGWRVVHSKHDPIEVEM